MHEIEVKARIVNKDRVIEQLVILGCVLSDPIIQKDRIFVPAGLEIPVDPGVNVLRIREQNGKYLLTLKQAVTNQLDCIEKETHVDNPQGVIDMFGLLGFHEMTAVEKTRQKCKYDGLEICLDSVIGLGDFIEVEKMAEGGDAEAIQKELFSFLESLGVDPKDQVFDGYDVLMVKAKYK